MIRLFILSFIFTTLVGCYTDSEAARKSKERITKSFEIYHDINWQNMPSDFSILALPTFNLAPNSNVYWDDGADKYIDDPSEEATKRFVMSMPYGEQQYLNIEHLPYRYDQTTVEQQLDTVRKLSMILHWAKTQRPDIEIGIFSMTVENYFNPLSTAPQEYLDRNKRFRALSVYAEVVYIDAYTWWENRPNKWRQGLETSVAQARLTGKKVIAFIWPHYQSPAANRAIIPGDEWRDELELTYKLTDGIVIWDKMTCDWQDINCADASDPTNWWYQTLDFMKQKGL